MYRWRKLSEQDQAALLIWRQGLKRPWHSPPHFVEGPALFQLTAACYEHAPIIGSTNERLQQFGADLLATLEEARCRVFAWCVLPNHYHLLLHVPDLRDTTRLLGRLHGRTSHAWNGEDDQRGRRVWSTPADRAIRGDSHFWATLNYIHHNPVKHGHVTRWQEWPWSSAHDYLETVGYDEAVRLWKQYPVLDYGKGWDD